jgi:hypothetical protein
MNESEPNDEPFAALGGLLADDAEMGAGDPRDSAVGDGSASESPSY